MLLAEAGECAAVWAMVQVRGKKSPAEILAVGPPATWSHVVLSLFRQKNDSQTGASRLDYDSIVRRSSSSTPVGSSGTRYR